MMNYYRYKLITPEGKISSGVVKLPYKETMSAINYLEREGNITLFVSKLGRLARGLRKVLDLRPQPRLSREMTAELLNNLGLMLKAGIPLMTALEEIFQAEEYPAIEKDVRELIERIQGGSSFSDAAERYPHIFPKNVIFLLRMGEETGRLDQMLKDAAEHLRRIQKIISDTKQALLYPIFVLTAVSGGMLFWFAYVVPKIVGLFKELDVALPKMTQILIVLSEFVEQAWVHIIITFVVGVAAVIIGRKRSRRFRKITDNLLLKLPLTKSIVSASALAYISEYFAMLINAGIDILQSVSILKNAVANEVYRDKLSEVRSNLELGDGVSDSFKRATIFPPFVVRMINVGETSGTLPDQLTYIAEQYHEKLSVIVATIGKSIEPLILLVAGTAFAVIIIGLFLPIYDLVSKVTSL